MTVPSRRDNLFAITMASMIEGGFALPRLFVDGPYSPELLKTTNLAVTFRGDPVGVYANWVLGMMELYHRNPHSTYFAMFQDDVVMYKNTRQYLERSMARHSHHDSAYYNLFSFPPNEINLTDVGWKPGVTVRDNVKQQAGLGAQALVFPRQALISLLSGHTLTDRVQNQTRGWRSVDGAVVETMNHVGYTEYVHTPSICQHIGETSTINKDERVVRMSPPSQPFLWGDTGKSSLFLGEDFDANNMETEAGPKLVQLGRSTCQMSGATVSPRFRPGRRHIYPQP